MIGGDLVEDCGSAGRKGTHGRRTCFQTEEVAMIRLFIVLLCVLIPVSTALAQAQKPADVSSLVSFTVDDDKVTVATDEICRQAGVRILLETTAEVKITASVTDMPVEEALSVICKIGDLAWRRIYIKANSTMLKNPETLASTLRLLENLKFPDLIVERTSADQKMIHVAGAPAVEAVPLSLRKEMGMVPIYLITNDRAAKLAKEKAESPVEEYLKLQKESVDRFVNMAPEQREQAMLSGMQFMQQLDPNYMSVATRAIMRDPVLAEQAMVSWMQSMAAMSPQERAEFDVMMRQAAQSLRPPQQ